MGGACSAYGGEEKHIQCLVGKPEGKKQLGRPRCSWEDVIKMDVKEVEYGDMDCFEPKTVGGHLWMR
jgi:hypothetical protein